VPVRLGACQGRSSVSYINLFGTGVFNFTAYQKSYGPNMTNQPANDKFS